MTLREAGYQLIAGAVGEDEVRALNRAVDGCLAKSKRAGTRRMLDHPAVRAFGGELVRRLDAVHRPAVIIQCILFEKDDMRNWLVPPHRDTAMPVRCREQLPAYAPWTEKEGVQSCQLPLEFLRTMTALRVHLDACGEEHGALQVVPGSHCDVGTQPGVAVPAQAGDVIAMVPCILHSSSKATRPNRRRVLHYVVAPVTPPPGLEWPANAQWVSG